MDNWYNLEGEKQMEENYTNNNYVNENNTGENTPLTPSLEEQIKQVQKDIENKKIEQEKEKRNIYNKMRSKHKREIKNLQDKLDLLLIKFSKEILSKQ